MTLSARRRKLVDELVELGWPSVAEDVAEGYLPLDTILRRLESICEDESDAYDAIVAAQMEGAE
jgi:hypothetical protein